MGKDTDKLFRIRRRLNRTPLDIPNHLHTLIDDILKKNHGWKPRSEGVFATKRRNTASRYGAAHLFFPIGNYKYLYSEDVVDLYQSISVEVTNKMRAKFIEWEDDVPSTRNIKPEHVDDEFKERLTKVLSRYKDSGYGKSSGSIPIVESMFDVSEYYIITSGKDTDDIKFWRKVMA